jgi:hypothetical protein
VYRAASTTRTNGSSVVCSERPDFTRAHPVSYSVGTGDFPPGVKRPEREADHYLQLVPKSRKPESVHLLSHTSSWRSASLVKHRDNFTFISIFVVNYLLKAYRRARASCWALKMEALRSSETSQAARLHISIVAALRTTGPRLGLSFSTSRPQSRDYCICSPPLLLLVLTFRELN